MAADNAATPVVDDEWEVKPPKKAGTTGGGDDEWSITPPNAAPNPKTGEGMEQAALAQSHSLFTPNKVVGQDAHGQPVYDKPPNPIDKAAQETGEREKRLGAAENRAMQSPTPFTNASMVIAPLSGLGESVATKGLGPTLSAVAKPVIRTTLGAVGGSAAGGYGGRELGRVVGRPEEGAQIGATVGGIAGGLYGGMRGEPVPEPEVFPVSKSPGPYRGPSSVPPNVGKVSEGPGPYTGPSSVPKPATSTGPSLFESGADYGSGRGNEPIVMTPDEWNSFDQRQRIAEVRASERGTQFAGGVRTAEANRPQDRLFPLARHIEQPHGTSVDFPSQGPTQPTGPAAPVTANRRVTQGASPTGVERRTQALTDYQNAIQNTPPGQPTPGEKMAQDIRAARAGAPSGITEGEALQWIMKDVDTYNKYKAADPKIQGQMLIQAKNELLKMK